MSGIAELVAKVRMDDTQFISEQQRVISLSEQLTVKFDRVKQAASGYAKKINSISVDAKKLSQAQNGLVSAVDVASVSLQKNSANVSNASAQYKHLRKEVLQAKSALEAFTGVDVGTASLGSVEQFRGEIKRLKDDLRIKTELAVNIKMADSASFISEQKKVLETLELIAVKVDKVTKAFTEYNKQFKTLVTRTKNWTQSQGKASAGIEKMTTAARHNLSVSTKWTQQLEALHKEVTQIIASSKAMASEGFVPGSAEEVKKVRGEVEKLKTELDGVSATAPALKSAFASIAKYAIGAFSINEVKGMLDTYTTLTNRIKLVTDSEKQLQEVRAGLARISSSTGQNLDATAAIYQRLAQASDQAGLSGQKLLTVTELISKAMVIGGGSAKSQEAALIQLGQALASGVLRGEELNSVMEQAPGLSMAIAKGMGVTVGALKTLGASGKITSQQLIDAIMKQSKQIETDFSKTSRTIDQALQNIKTQLTMFIGGANEASGAAKVLTATLQAVANNIDLVAAAVLGFLGVKLASFLLATTAEVVAFTASLALQAAAATKAAQANAVYAASLTTVKGSAAVQNILSLKDSFKKLGMAVTAFRATAVGGIATAVGGVGALIAVTAAAAYSVYQVGKSIHALFNGQDPHNTISDVFDTILRKVGFLKNDVETLGTRLYDLTHNSKGEFRLKGLITFQTEQEEKDAKKQEQLKKEHEARQKDPKTADLSKEAIDAKEKLQKLSDKTEKAAEELGKSKQQLATKNAEELLAQLKTKTQNEAAIKAAEELVKKVRAATAKVEVGELSESITQAHDKIAEAVKNFGKTSEEIEISKQQIALETMARKGATAAQVAAAKAKVEDTQKLYAHQKALEDEKKNREENNKYLKDMKTKAAELAAELAGGKDGLIAFQLASKNASAEKIREAQVTNKLVEQLQAQLQVTQTLASLKDQVAKLGMTETQKQLYDLQKQGASAEQLNQAKVYLDQLERWKTLQDKTKKAAEKLDTAATSLTDTAKSVGKISMFSKEARLKEEDYWKKKREEEKKEDSGVFFISGKRKVEDLNVDKLNLPANQANPASAVAAGLKGDGLTGAKEQKLDLVHASKIEAQTLLVGNKLANDANTQPAAASDHAGATETLKIDFSYNGKNISGDILTSPVFKKAFMKFFEGIVADMAKNLA
ncbi:tape measure protein [Snodgrassella alvi]|uniref:tape measure protein n=1 Tax=Snodgrassella alvi TaxID=1196083 RepID=UPI00117B01BE|nr:tape measure protein [Snodgrassella alvi]